MNTCHIVNGLRAQVPAVPVPLFLFLRYKRLQRVIMQDTVVFRKHPRDHSGMHGIRHCGENAT
ncbi:MAG: hypothetical protein DDT36_01540 [Firmicutes bacterium]|nr:hypothetical protein [Bacillota bacterium]